MARCRIGNKEPPLRIEDYVRTIFKHVRKTSIRKQSAEIRPSPMMMMMMMNELNVKMSQEHWIQLFVLLPEAFNVVAIRHCLIRNS